MRLREPFKRKHVHSWKFQFDPRKSLVLRACTDCPRVEMAVDTWQVLNDTLSALPETTWPYAELDWREYKETPTVSALANDMTFSECSTPNRGGKREHTVAILMHYTLTRSVESAVAWYSQDASRKSVHYVLGRDGSGVALSQHDDICWHAGKSHYRGHTDLDSCTVAIALENLGPLIRRGDGYVSAVQGVPVETSDVHIGRHSHRGCNYALWHAYTPAQLATATQLVSALRRYYAQDLPVVPHSVVAARRAIGPGPALDKWLAYQAELAKCKN